MTSERQRSDSAAPTDQPIDRPPRKITVYVGIVTAVVVLLAVLALFLFRALAGREPGHVAVVQGNERWVGALLVVSGPSLPKPYEAKIERAGRYAVPFFLPAGDYELRVLAGGADALHRRFELRSNPKIQIDLPPDGPATRPVAAAP